MLGLGWQYRWGCIRLLVLQACCLLTALGALRLLGLGIDLIRWHVGAADQPPRLPFGPVARRHWPPLAQVALIAGLILLLELIRGTLNYIYALSAGYLIHTRIVPDLRSQVYDKLQRLSFRFFDANATGTIINRVTGDVQTVRVFIDGVLIQFVMLVVSLVCYLAYMLSLHVGLTLACLATTPLMWWSTVDLLADGAAAVRPNRELVDRDGAAAGGERFKACRSSRASAASARKSPSSPPTTGPCMDQQQGIFWRVSIFTPTIGY